MPAIDTAITIDAPRDRVWALAQDIERFPEIMPDLDKVTILEREQKSPHTVRVVSLWNGRIAKFNRKVNWTEEDVWNSESFTCHFWQLMGDFTDYRGEWSFHDEGDKTQVKLHIDYRFEVPLIGPLLQKVVQNLLQDNSEGMLKALKTEAEKTA